MVSPRALPGATNARVAERRTLLHAARNPGARERWQGHDDTYSPA